MASPKLHADDTPVPVLSPGSGKTATGRLWVYVRDNRRWRPSDKPAALYRYSPDRKGERPREHLKTFVGFLQADAYAGFDKLYAADRRPGLITPVACWAHVRRKLHDVLDADARSIAREGLVLIGDLYEVERQITRDPHDDRRKARKYSRLKALDFFQWADGVLAQVSARAVNPSQGLQTPSLARSTSAAISEAHSTVRFLLFGIIRQLSAWNLGSSATPPPPWLGTHLARRERIRRGASTNTRITCMLSATIPHSRRILPKAAIVIALAQPHPAAFAQSLDASPRTRIAAELRCLIGAYSLSDGSTVTITGTGGEPRTLAYTLNGGRFGALREVGPARFQGDGISVAFAPCSAGTLQATFAGRSWAGTKLPIVVRDTSFTSDGIKLQGKLVYPAFRRTEVAAVWIEGSNNDPSTDDAIWPYELARRGIAVFVYDKRGTGASDGEQSSNFRVRARDTAAAVRALREIAPTIGKVGVIGGSQGGWVAPLVASLVPLDFVIPAFAMAEGPIAQDRELVELQLRAAGFRESDLRVARQLTRITASVVRSNLTDGSADQPLAKLDAFKRKHGGAPWLKAIEPRSYTGLFLGLPTSIIKSSGAAMAQGLMFDYDPLPVIAAIKPRQLWLLGGRDRQAPNTNTQRILKRLQQRGRPIDVVVFPHADHGLIEPIATTAGPTNTYSAELFDVAADWILKGKRPQNLRFVVMSDTRSGR